MSFVTMDDLFLATVESDLSGRKGGGFMPPPPPPPPPGGGDDGSQQQQQQPQQQQQWGQQQPQQQQQWGPPQQQQWGPPQQPQQQQQWGPPRQQWGPPPQAQSAPQQWGPPGQQGAPDQTGGASGGAPAASAPSWWGSGASNFFPTSPPPSDGTAAPPQMGDALGMGGALGAVIEYIRPATRLNEGAFLSSMALEAGGDDMSDDVSMGEEMVYEGLTANDADKVPNQSIADSVDAGGQGPFVDVATMSSGNWESDDGTGVDVLVEPGQASAPRMPAPRVDRATSYRTNDIPDAAPVVPAGEEPPVFRPARNGAPAKNGTAPTNGVHHHHRNGANGTNGVAPRNRITAYSDAAPLIQGTGAATISRPRGFSTVAPPNPASFGLGQAPAPAPAADPMVDFAKQLASTTGQIGTAVVLSKAPPQYLPPSPVGPGGDLMALQRQQQLQQAGSQGSSTMPWVLGILGVGVVGLGVWWLTRKKKDDVEAAPAPAPAPAPALAAAPAPVARNYPRRAKATKKNKKSKRR